MSYRVRGVPSGKSAINHHIFKPSTTPATAPNSFEEQLPQYFIVRPDVTKHTASGRVTTKGPMVPLIPMDQLPSWLEIVGVPRELDIEQMRGLKNLGEAPGDFSWYEVCLTNRCLRSNKGPIQATNGELKRQQSDSSSEQPLRKTVAAVAGEQHTTGGSKTTVNSHNTNRICSKPGRRDRSNINVHQRTDTALRSSGSDSDSRGVRRPSLSSSSKASASGSTHSDMTCHSQRKAGIGASRHATPDCTEPIAARTSPPSPIVPLDPRLPTPSYPGRTAPFNPDPLIRRGGPPQPERSLQLRITTGQR